MSEIDEMIRSLEEPTWENAKRIVGNSLRWWDKWCPDDGRIAEGFEMVVRYVDEPFHGGLLWLDITGVVIRTRKAFEMVRRTLTTEPKMVTGKVSPFNQVWIAYCVAEAVVRLQVALAGQSEHPEVHDKEAIQWAKAANLGAFVTYPNDWDLDEDEDEDEEAGEVVAASSLG
jgi:hypothetical protein